MNTVPEGYIKSKEEFCSNFDGIINQNVADELKKDKAWASYPAWNWFGKVWFDKKLNLYACQVMCYGSHVNTIYGETPDVLKENVCSMYGYD